MNNKGFAISSIMYGILIIFLILVFSTLSILVTRGNSLSKIKNNALNTIIGGSDDTAMMSNIVADFSSMNITSDASNHVTVNYNINLLSEGSLSLIIRSMASSVWAMIIAITLGV